MEEIIELDDFLIKLQAIKITYAAVYDLDTGKVLSVGPIDAFVNEPNKIVIEQELAHDIIEGRVKINSCVVNLKENTLEVAEIKRIFKIDDVLHRIVDTQWSDLERADIYVVYDTKKQSLTFEMTEEFHGTRKMAEKFQPVYQRKVIWDGEMVMNFLVTDYNDPNILYNTLSLKVSDLHSKSKVFKNLDLPEKFSVYTRRLFKDYVMEYK